MLHINSSLYKRNKEQREWTREDKSRAFKDIKKSIDLEKENLTTNICPCNKRYSY